MVRRVPPQHDGRVTRKVKCPTCEGKGMILLFFFPVVCLHCDGARFVEMPVTKKEKTKKKKEKEAPP